MTSVLNRAELAEVKPIPRGLQAELDTLSVNTVEAIGSIAAGSEKLTPTYTYTPAYDNRGNIIGATSESFDPSSSTTTTTEFDGDGKELTQHVVSPGQEARYENGVLRYRYQAGAGSDYVAQWFDAKGDIERSTTVDTFTNKLIVTLHKNGKVGPVDVEYKYRGNGGWV